MNKLEVFVSKLIHFEIQALFASIFCLGLEKNAAFRFGFLNKINSVNFSILLSIGTYTFLNVFVSFRYRISSISKLYYRTFLFLQVGCRAGGMQDKRAVEQEGFRTGGVQDRRGVGQEGCRTGVMQEKGMQGNEGSRNGGIKERRD